MPTSKKIEKNCMGDKVCPALQGWGGGGGGTIFVTNPLKIQTQAHYFNMVSSAHSGSKVGPYATVIDM